MEKSVTTTKPTSWRRRRTKRIRLPALRLLASERRLLLAVMDLLLVNGALIAALWLTTDLISGLHVVWAAAKWFITLTVVWLIMSAVFDIYNLARAASASASMTAVMATAVLTSVIYLVIPWLTPPIVNRSQGFLFVVFSAVILSGWRYVYARLFVQPTFHRHVLVVGAGQSGRELVEALRSDYARQDANPFRGTGYQIVGFVDDDPLLQRQTVADVPVLGDSEKLVKLARALAVDEVVVAITYTDIINPRLMEAILDCREMGLPVTTMATIYERLTGRVAVDHTGQNIELAGGTTRENPFSRLYAGWKRLVDIWGAATAALVLILVIPFVWLANRLASPGPLFFRQERVGLGGKPFMVIKFRSMIPEAEKGQGAVWAVENDTRVTAVGRFLRRTHLDELPQVMNVLRGEMSLIGPRPERPEFVRLLSGQISFYRIRHCVKPGITGWAQIHQDYGDSIEGSQEKLEYDLYYVKHATPILDILITLRTISKVLGLKGR
jgi:exopolysaccharide biosynthesis polyprenyl glycosylphosphotransferase